MTPTDWAGELTALESRADTDSLEGLHQRRRALVYANAKLVALYGSFGMWDDHRKRMVEAMKVKARMELSAGSEKKPTEGAIDATAYASEQYGRFIDDALDEKIEYLNVMTQLDEIAEKIRSRELALVAYAKEISLR